MVVARNGRNQANPEMRMMAADGGKCSLQIGVVAAKHSLLIGSSPCSSNHVGCEIDISFLLVEIVDLYHLQVWRFLNRPDQTLMGCRGENPAFDDAYTAGRHFSKSLEIDTLPLWRFGIIRHPAKNGGGVVAYFNKIGIFIKNVILEK